MSELSAVIYGILQGLTEFLPVSSSGHLALLPHILNIKDPGVIFDLSMHVGTAFSIILYFYRDIRTLINDLLAFIFKKNKPKSFVSINMVLATMVTFILVLLLKDFSKMYGRNPMMIALNLALFGFFMFFADAFCRDEEKGQMEDFQWWRSTLIGTFQALAIFPGVSRSGGTLTISRFIGLGREEATRFSFLLSLPIIMAGFFYKLPVLISGGESFSLSTCLIGIIISFGTGLFTIHYFLKFIKKMGLWLFSLYRLILALLIFIYS
ncbi:MAG: undecaprenyl-diphosphate phosphatase [Bacteriovoracaceae bacterium]|nr:undecaprenyl-diphosphate phosphatase [Bacteriovoracaceae bacterium]